MKNRLRLNHVQTMLATCAVFWGFAPVATAQPSTPADVQVNISEGIYHFLQDDRAGYENAIGFLDDALKQAPDHPAALLFRSLAHGQLGLLTLRSKNSAGNNARNWSKAADMRENPARVEEIKSEIADLESQLEADTDRSAEWVLNGMALKQLQELLTIDKNTKDISHDDLLGEARDFEIQALKLANEERVHYLAMRRDLDRLLGNLDEPETVVGLLRVIAMAKSARIDEKEAVAIKTGLMPAGPVSALRESSKDILRQTAGALEEMRKSATGLDAVRTNFFLGVIRFRQAVPVRAKDEQLAVNYKLLAQAEALMTALADDPQVDVRWRSYGALYSGLMIPFRANRAVDKASRLDILDEGNRRLNQALALDVRRPNADSDPVSVSGSIPGVVRRQRAQIAAMRDQEPGAPRRTNDIQISLGIGAQRDTNVLLLGERTDLDRGIGGPKDFGFDLGFALDYTVSLSDQWMLGAQARTTQLWHVEIDEFDEQRYGGSVALQYEISPQKGTFGPVQLRLQYDYDYVLLGKSAFVETHRLTPNLRFFWHNRRAETNIYFSYEIRDYFEQLSETRFNRDGVYPEVGIIQYYKMLDMVPVFERMGLEPWGAKGDDALKQDDPDYPARYLAPFIGFQYSWDSTDGDEFDQNEFMLLAGARVPIPWGWYLNTSVELQWQDYRHPSLVDFHRRPRRDFVQTYSVSLDRTYVLRGGELINRYTPTMDRVLMTVRAFASFTNNDSNVVDRLGEVIFEYDRTVYGLSFGFTFN